MQLSERIDLMVRLGEYFVSGSDELETAVDKAFEKNKWFTPEFVHLSLKNLSTQFLQNDKLQKWVKFYHLDDQVFPRTVGVVMAGNIPLVGFHDFLSVFLCGHRQKIKLSEKDEVLMKHILEKLSEWNAGVAQKVSTHDMLRDCDAYIATGSNNSSRYFQYYFGKYPSIIRNNKTSVAVLSGHETPDQLRALADDVYTYFGLGCRNVTKLYVPQDYDFLPLLEAFKKYDYLSDHTKYRNNYDYQLALLIMNNRYYMTNNTIILTENSNVFSAVSELHYSYYTDADAVFGGLKTLPAIQAIVADGHVAFGQSQVPSLFTYADGVDTMQFLLSL